MFSKERIESELIKWDTDTLIRLKNYYDGKHDILNREMDANKPNNKLVHNYPSYIVDMFQGYFIGNPVVYTSQNEELMGKVQDIFNYNDEQDENSELARQMGIYGRGQEILYIDEDSNIRFNAVSPLHLKIIYNQSITPSIIGAIRLYRIDSDDGETYTEYAEVYDEAEVATYQMPGMAEIERRPHFFGDVPVVDYQNNSDIRGDFEGVISLIDAYNRSRSNKTNDLDYFTDAYLKLLNMMGTSTDDVNDMRNNRVILLDENADAEFLIKPSNVEDAKQQVETLNNDIHKFSKALDMSDENFASNASGVAMGYKLLAMEQIAANKERKFKRGLQRRLELICNHLNMKSSTGYDYLEIAMKFERNEPVDEALKIQGALQLNGFTSKETALAYLPSSVVSDVAEELDRIDDEKGSYPTMTVSETQTIDVQEPEIQEADIEDEAKKVSGKTLNGAQTQSLMSVMEQYSAGTLTIGQAINVISISIGVSKEEAKNILEGLE